MKKTAAQVLGFSLIASQLSPALAEASESNVVDYKTNEEIGKNLDEDFDYKVEKNVSENVDRIEVKLGEEETVALFDRENGRVTVDGELVATFKEIPEESDDSSETELSPEIDMFNLQGYPEYNIGVSHGSGVWYITKSKKFQISFVKQAQAAAIAATLVGSFLDDKPSMKAAAIVAAAASVAALVVSEATVLNVSVKARKDKYDAGERSDFLDVYNGSNKGLFRIHFNYWTSV